DRVLERDGHDRREVELRDGRELLRRQRPARADRFREPRLRAGALPQHQRHQHGEESVSAREATVADARGLTREQCEALIQRVVKMSKADGVQVNVSGGYNANVRFADNRISTAGGVSTATVAVQSSFGPKHAVTQTNDFSEAGLERAVRQSEALAKL